MNGLSLQDALMSYGKPIVSFAQCADLDSVEQFLNSVVYRLGEEANQVVSILAGYAFGVNINIMAVGGSQNALNEEIMCEAEDPMGLMKLETDSGLWPMKDEEICLFFRPGHYEVVYRSLVGEKLVKKKHGVGEEEFDLHISLQDVEKIEEE